MSETAAHDHEFEVLEDDQTVPPRPEEEIADASTGAEVRDAVPSRSGEPSVAAATDSGAVSSA